MAKQKDNDPKLPTDQAAAMQILLKGVNDQLKRQLDLSNSLTDSVKEQNEELKRQILERTKGGKEIAKILDFNRDLTDENKLLTKNIEIKNKMLKEGLSASMAELVVAEEHALTAAKEAGATEAALKLIKQKYEQAKKVSVENEKLEHSLEEQERLAERIKETEEERKKLLEGINTRAKLMKDIFTDSRVAAAVFTSQLIKGYDYTKELFEEVRKEGYTIGQSFHEVGLAMSDAFSLTGTSAKDSLEVMSGLREEMGDISQVTKEARLEAASLARTYGISNHEAGKLTAQFAMMPGASMESANNTLEFAGNLAKAAHVAPGEVMKSIAENAEDVALYSKDGGKNIAAAAVAAKKLGVEFSTLTKMNRGLLDFENSINKQMEASVLLGREINLDKARAAALNGDLVGATKEMLANIGGEAQYNNMNVLQREALANSMGVSVQELSKMVKNQDKLNNLTQEQQDALAKGEMTMDEALASAAGLGEKLWEGTKTVGSMVMGFGEINEGLKAAKDGAKALFGGMMGGLKAMSEGGGLKGGIKGALGLDKAKEQADTVGGAGDKVKGGGGFKGAMTGLADGFKEMGKPGVKQGIINIALAGPAMILGITATPFMAIVAALGNAAGKGLQGLSEGLKGKGMGAALVGLGIANLALFGLASIPAVLGLPFLIGVALTGYLAGLGMKGLAEGLKAMSKVPLQGILAVGLLGAALIPAAIAFALLANVDTEKMITFSIALPLLGLAAAGLGFLFPFIAAGAASLALLGVGMIAVAGGLAVLQGAEGGIGIFENLTTLATNAAGLGTVAMSLVGIAGGLGAMAVAGLMAMPAIGALIALAAVAPALSGLGGALGGMFGGGGGGEEEDKMDTLIAEIRELKAIAAKGGVINMDGKKVGDIVRLATNSANVR